MIAPKHDCTNMKFIVEASLLLSKCLRLEQFPSSGVSYYLLEPSV